MRDISDEVLMAYADNALEPKLRAEVAGRIAQEPKLAERMQAFVVTGKPLANVFDRVIDEPIPARILAALDAPSRPAASVHVLKPRFRPAALGNRNDVWRMAAALVIGLGTGWGFKTIVSTAPGSGPAVVALENGQMLAQGALRQVLDNGASGQFHAISGGVIFVDYSFKSRDGGFCRQYHVNAGNDRAFSGVACRNSGGAWPIAAQADADPRPVDTGKTGKIVAAGKKNPAIDATVDGLIATDVMSVEQEADIIRKGWRVQP